MNGKVKKTEEEMQLMNGSKKDPPMIKRKSSRGFEASTEDKSPDMV